MSVVHPADFTEGHILFVKLFRKRVNRLIAALPDRLIHLYLHHKVAAALKIKPQLDAVGEILLYLSRGSRKFRQSDQTKNANENHEQDEYEFPLELGTHAGWLALLRWFSLHSCYSGARHLDLHLLCDAQLD